MTDDSKSKIIIDEDWKSRVEAEKAELELNRAAPKNSEPKNEGAKNEAPNTSPSGAARGAAEGTAEPAGDDVQLPPASIGSMIMMLASQAMIEMGQIPSPLQQKPVVRLSIARHYIDSLAILEEKTKGNLTEQESRYLAGILDELRMVFVRLKK